jgi:hypothetical protein
MMAVDEQTERLSRQLDRLCCQVGYLAARSGSRYARR